MTAMLWVDRVIWKSQDLLKKGSSSKKFKILSAFTLIVQTCMTFFSAAQKKIFWRCFSCFVCTIKVSGVLNNIAPHWLSVYRQKTLRSILFCALQNKEMHTVHIWNDMSKWYIIFGWTINLNDVICLKSFWLNFRSSQSCYCKCGQSVTNLQPTIHTNLRCHWRCWAHSLDEEWHAPVSWKWNHFLHWQFHLEIPKSLSQWWRTLSVCSK